MNEKILKIIAKSLDISVNYLTPEVVFVDDLGVDSLELMELAVELEDNLRIEIPTEDMENVQTVGDLLEYLGEIK